MMYPLVRELAVDGIPVTVTCRVLELARAPYYRWLQASVTEDDWVAAHRANALFDAHLEDPEFGYRYLIEEAADDGQVMAQRTAWAIWSQKGCWSAFGKKRAKNGKKPGPPVHDDRCAVTDEHGVTRHVFTADASNQVWLADITENRTGEGKLYLCAVKDAYSNRIVGYSIDSRMKSRLAVAALDSAVARRGNVAKCILHTDRGSQGGFNWSSQHLDHGGVGWDERGSRCRRRRPGRAGSGHRTGRCGRRCARRGGRSRRERYSGSSGG